MLSDARLAPVPGLAHLRLAESAVPKRSAEHLVELLEGLPVVAADAWDPRRALALHHPVHGGGPIPRAEAAAGVPVAWQGSAAVGAPMPPLLAQLAAAAGDLCRRGLADLALNDRDLELTSVYVDRHRPGGQFPAHTDRDIYGPLVVCVSLGRGTAHLRYASGPDEVHVRVPPGSVYALCGPARHAPWTHEVVTTSDHRWAITFRTAAPDDTRP